ncbi:leucine--tRNA ligase [Methanohalophilus portucalensis]|uniref:Leucine--tRNA ligase n=2 Tax=Methanohalophilus portucalensis TaxID=39664 RepID=A0A1L9C358_9EURY|nr:leucine--tRNA ligase [Methanohalophilus portucalensis]ATU09200.1 leucine--tRNA ligase [Methanohalophilus portucalensis]OJH48955.1 leucyl-tRNA synthetase [Methanohalophilus portucalensis FDF-1]RNI10365.1 leucine--tRNA ligase [Methanohalophilus portucalensis FDF-1]SMH38066.1 leucyl-tRNA synthetase [Methanohalophilus portucalensis FDF-1]
MEQNYKPATIEKRWQNIWSQDKVFEAEPDSRDKYFITIPYPYLNGNLHAGHTRTFTIGDVIARHKRMQGYNVLYPMGFHVTGTPIVGLAELITNREPQTMEVYSKFHGIPKDILEGLDSPEKIVEYFSVEAEKAMRSIGYSIDWRRKFTTTDETYKKFIEWQYNLLYEKGLIVKGSHPVKWCPNDDNPVEDHDILRGEEATIVDYTLIKFTYDGMVLPCATLRPETTFGVTNLWINPDVEYVKAKVKTDEYEETWIVSEEAYNKLTYTDRRVEFIEKISGLDIIGIKVKNPLTDSEVITLPASFVRGGNGSGVVMSVPAHAPYDYLALKDLYDKDLSEYGITENLQNIQLIPLIDVPEYGEYPAVEAVEEFGVQDQDDPKAESATKMVYRREFHGGTLKENTGKYAGTKVSKIKDLLTQDLIDEKIGEIFYEFSEPVVCRCGTPCVVNMVKGQWFLNYSNPEWKDKVYRCIENMDIIPEELRVEFNNKVDWLKDKACARKKGLGTRLPFDKDWLIESLGDSTVYMSYYIVAKFLSEDIKTEQLVPELFDHVLLGKGSVQYAAERSGIDASVIESMREDFNYWYPVNLRSSGKDLIPNHLLFFLFHHVAIFGEENWPRAIAINGFVSLEGQKMSKSKGPLLTLSEAVKDYGADISRMYILSSAEQTQDADWKNSGIESARRQVDRFYHFAKDTIDTKCTSGACKEKQLIDRWIQSRLQQRISETNEALKSIRTRQALQNSFFLLLNDVKWYQRRGGKTLQYDILDTWVRLMAPFTPHICEEIWSEMEETQGYVSLEKYPEYDPQFIDRDAEAAEELISNTFSDVEEIIKVTGIKPQKLVLYTASQWKSEAFKQALELQLQGDLNPGILIKKLMQDPEMRPYGKEVPKFAKKVVDDIKAMKEDKFEMVCGFNLDEKETLKEAISFFEKEIGCEVQITREGEETYDPEKKARFAAPMRPAIYLE